MIKMCAFVISTEGPQSGPKWRNLVYETNLLFSNQISRLRCASLEMTQASAITNQKSYYFFHTSVVGLAEYLEI